MPDIRTDAAKSVVMMAFMSCPSSVDAVLSTCYRCTGSDTLRLHRIFQDATMEVATGSALKDVSSQVGTTHFNAASYPPGAGCVLGVTTPLLPVDMRASSRPAENQVVPPGGAQRGPAGREVSSPRLKNAATVISSRKSPGAKRADGRVVCVRHEQQTKGGS